MHYITQAILYTITTYQGAAANQKISGQNVYINPKIFAYALLVITNNIINNNNNNNNNDNNNNNNDNNNNNNNMNMGGNGRQWFEEPSGQPLMNFVETINDRFQMVDRAIQTVYPSCHEAYQCYYGSKMLEFLPK